MQIIRAVPVSADHYVGTSFHQSIEPPVNALIVTRRMR